MKVRQFLQSVPASQTVMAVILLTCLGGVAASTDLELPEPDCESNGNSLTAIWHGTYVNQNDVVSHAYLDVTEHADGSLSGKWGNGPQSALTIENGERVTQNLFQWEAASPANEQGRYRIRATHKGDTLHLDITYTWRENGKVKGLTAFSTLTRNEVTTSASGRG